jgi:hypothetical protein
LGSLALQPAALHLPFKVTYSGLQMIATAFKMSSMAPYPKE